jgi:CARDB/FG-GAP-like repeat/Putative Ig domain
VPIAVSRLLGVLVASWIALSASWALAQPTNPDAGYAWLRSRQDGSGWIADDARLRQRDGSEVLRLFDRVFPFDPIVVPLVTVLAAESSPTVDLEARRLSAVSRHYPYFLLQRPYESLLLAQTQDGGWGFDGNYAQSTALETALVLAAISQIQPLPATQFLMGLFALGGSQNVDGGFGAMVGAGSDNATTANVLRAISVISGVTNTDVIRSRAIAYLLSTINPDGGFPNVVGEASNLVTTALVLNALFESGAADPSLLRATQLLAAAQSANGSWGNDVYLTALALGVTGRQEADLAAVSMVLAPFSVEQGTPSTVTISTHNLGFATADPTTVALYAGDPNSGGSLLGTLPIPALTPAATTSTTFVVSTESLNGATPLYAVVDPNLLVTEHSEINNRRQAVLVVRPFGSPPPSDGNQPPQFSSIAPTYARVGSLYQYPVIAFDPEGTALSYEIVFNPGGMFIGASGMVTWTPVFSGPFQAIIQVSDSEGNRALQVVRGEVLPTGIGGTRPPVFESAPLSTAQPGLLYRYVVQASDPDGGSVQVLLSDAPTGAVFDPSTGVLSFTPTAEQVGEHVLRLTAIDDEFESTPQSWMIHVAPLTDDSIDLVVLQVSAETALFDPQALSIAGSVHVEVGNQGVRAAKNAVVRVFEDRDRDSVFSAPDVILGTTSIPSLASGVHAALDVSVSGVAQFRDNRLFAIVDPTNLIRETLEDNNVRASGAEKRLLSVHGAFAPSSRSFFVQRDSYVPPIVGQLNDDNGDGRIDERDVPEIVVTTFNYTTSGPPPSVRVIDGRTGEVSMTVDPSVVPSTWVSSAIADLDADGVPELLVPDISVTGVAIIDPLGNVIRRIPGNAGSGEAVGLTVADLDGDGKGEIFGTTRDIYRHDGSLYCTLPIYPQDLTTVVIDLDLDGRPEILRGGVAFRGDCSIYWAHNIVLGQGEVNVTPAVGQMDDDPYPELVYQSVSNGSTNAQVYLLEHDGTLKRRLNEIGLGTDQTVYSPPLVADLDGDGQSEIVARVEGSRGVYAAYEIDGTIRWSRSVYDLSCCITVTSTAADLDGDGKAEVVIQDSRALTILRGTDGAILFEAPADTGTRYEHVVPADVDADGRIDLVSVGNRGVTAYKPLSEGTTAFRVLSDFRWAAGRTLWNEATYHTTNVRCDQKLPPKHLPFWHARNVGLRTGGPVPDIFREELGCMTGVADLTASLIQIDRSGCPSTVEYIVRVGNGGQRSAPAGIPVAMSHAPHGAPFAVLPTVVTSRSLFPGEFEDVRIRVPAELVESVIVAALVDPENTIGDGRVENNGHSTTVVLCGPENQQPVFSTTPFLSATVGQQYQYAVAAGDSDGDVLTLALTTGPGGMTLSPQGALSWLPSASDIGPHLVSLSVTDARGGVAVQEFVVVVGAADLHEPLALPFLPDAHLTVTTDAPSYGIGETIQIATTLKNDQIFGRAGYLSIEIQDAANELVARVDSVDTLFTGPGTQVFNNTFDVDIYPPGSYWISATYIEPEHGQLQVRVPFEIEAATGLAVVLTTDQPTYAVGAIATLNAKIANLGANAPIFALRSRLEIVAPGGAVVFSNTDAPHILAAEAIEPRSVQWATSVALAGAYLARIVVSNGIQTLATIERPFTVVDVPRLVGTFAASPDPVSRGEDVTGTLTVTNAGNLAVAGDVMIRIVDPDVPSVVAETLLLTNLAPGQSSTLTASFGTAALALKQYVAQVEIVPAGTLDPSLLNLYVPFTVVGSAAPTVSIAVPGCGPGPVVPIVTVTGSGIVSDLRSLDGQPYDGLPVVTPGQHVLVVTVTNVVGETRTASATFTIDAALPVVTVEGVANGAFYRTNVAATVTVGDANLVTSTVTLDGQPYVNGSPIFTEGPHRIVAEAVDCAQNRTQAVFEFDIDTTAPVVNVATFPACSAGGVTPTFEATDTNLDLVMATLDGLPFVVGTVVSIQGPHLLEVTATDRAGNTSTSTVAFIVDTSAPVVVVSGVVENGFYATQVFPTVSVTDSNLVESLLYVDGSPFVGGSAVAAGGSHLLQVQATDCAGNTTTRSISFTVDLEPPLVTIGNVPACGNNVVIPKVIATDGAVASITATLDGQPYILGTVIAAEGAHLLSVVAIDSAGNAVERTAAFVIDMTAPGVVVSGVGDGAVTRFAVAPVVTITDTNLTGNSVILNGSPFTAGTVIDSEGQFVLSADATDCAGNNAGQTIAFAIDRTPPAIVIERPVACGSPNVTLAATVNDLHVGSTTAMLDGSPVALGTTVSAEGAHLFVVSATDGAGNSASASAAFVLDRTPPAIAIGGVTNGGSYPPPVTPVVTVSDANATNTTTTLNGVPFVGGTAVATPGSYTLQVTSTDCAGNVGISSTNFVVDGEETDAVIVQSLPTAARVLVARECDSCAVPPVLAATLNAAEIPYDSAFNRAGWVTKMRSGAYNLIFLIDPDPYEGGYGGVNPNPGGDALSELAAAVWAGDSVVLIKSHPDAMPKLREVLGVHFKGRLKNVTSVTTLPPLSPSVLTASGSAVDMSIEGATLMGSSISSKVKPAIALYSIGLGQTASLAWDTETSNSQAFYQSLIAAVGPTTGLPILPLSPVTVTVTVTQSGSSSTSFLVHQLLPQALSSIDPTDRMIVVNPAQPFVFPFRLRASDQTGAVPLTAELRSGSTIVDSHTLSISVERDQAQITSDLEGVLSSLVLSGTNDNQRDTALWYIGVARTANTPLEAINATLLVMEYVKKISGVDVSAIRIDVARLLRTYQLEWQP